MATDFNRGFDLFLNGEWVEVDLWLCGCDKDVIQLMAVVKTETEWPPSKTDAAKEVLKPHVFPISKEFAAALSDVIWGNPATVDVSIAFAVSEEI